MSRDYGSSYDPKLVDRAYAVIVYSKIDTFCLKLSLLHFPYSPVRDYCHDYVRLFDILIYNLNIYEYFVGTKHFTLNLGTVLPWCWKFLCIAPNSTIR